MKLGIGSYSYGWQVGIPGFLPERLMSPDDILQKSVQLGLKVVQIADNLPLHQLEVQALEKLKKKAQDREILVEVGMRGLKPYLLDQYIEIARFFESNILRIVIDSQNYEPTKDEIISILRNFEQKLLLNNVVLAIENHDRFSAENLAEIVGCIDSDAVGICLDTVNSLGAGECIQNIINTLGPLTVNLHIKDFTIKRAPHGMGFNVEGCPVGTGMLDIPKLLEKFSMSQCNINAIIEMWTPPGDTLAETIAKEENWVIESVNYLRKLIPE